MRLCTVKSFPWGVLCTFYLVKSSHASSKISSLAGIKLTRVSLSFNGEHQSETSQVPANLFVLIEICAKCYGSRLKGGPATCLSRSCQRLMKWKCLLVYLQSWSDHKRFQCFPILAVLSKFGLVLVISQYPWCKNRVETENYSVLNDYFLLSPLKLLHKNKFVLVLVSLQYPLCTNSGLKHKIILSSIT